MLRFGHQNLKPKVFTSALDVYQMTFKVWGGGGGVNYGFIRKGWLIYVHSPLSILFKNYTPQINMPQPHRQINMYTMFWLGFSSLYFPI